MNGVWIKAISAIDQGWAALHDWWQRQDNDAQCLLSYRVQTMPLAALTPEEQEVCRYCTWLVLLEACNRQRQLVEEAEA